MRREVGMFGALMVMCLVLAVSNNDFLGQSNSINTLRQIAMLGIYAIGSGFVIITGGIDLSVGSVVGLTGVIIAKISSTATGGGGHSLALGITVALIVALLIGLAQGLLITRLGLQPFIVTLAGMLLFRGLTEILLEGQTLGPFPDGLQKMGNGFLPEVGPNTNYHNITLLLGFALLAFVVLQEVRDRKRQQEFALDVVPRNLFLLKLVAIAAAVLTVTMLLASYKGAPIILIILGLLVVGYGYIMRNAVFGRHIYAIGGNLPAAKLSGVRDKKVTFLVFLNMGMLAALAGLVFAARFNAASPKAGLNFELEAIAASFIGGASMSGGVGTVLGAIIGGLVLGVLNNGMNLLSVGTDWQQVIKGLALLAAVGFDVWNKRKSGS